MTVATECRTLTIGIDARAAAEVPAGRGRVVRELLRALSERDDDGSRFVLYARERCALPLDERFRWRLISARDPWWHVRAGFAASRECDVFFSTNSYLTPILLRIPAVTLVCDLIAFEPAMRPNRRSVAIERLTLWPAVRRSATMIAISRATADALGSRYPQAEAKTHVALLGVASTLAEEVNSEEITSLPPPGFVLAVGTLEPRKNLPRLVAAYSALSEDLQRSHPLVVVGALGWRTSETLDALRSLGERCIMLGYVSDAALFELYRRCAVFCYPSLGEGFGLPVAEAMSVGAAVLTANASSLPEVGGDAVEYVDPHDTASIADGLRRLLEDEVRRGELGLRARERAGELTWDRFATATLQILVRAAPSRAVARAE